MQIAAAIHTFPPHDYCSINTSPGIARRRTDERTGQTCPAFNLSLGKAFDADMLGRKSRVRSTSWPEAKASPTGRIHCRRPLPLIGTFRLQSGGGPYIARRADVNVRASSIAVLEQRQTFEHRGSGDAVETRKHPPVAQDTDIVERRLYGSEHLANYRFSLVHRITCEMCFQQGRGAGEGSGSPLL